MKRTAAAFLLSALLPALAFAQKRMCSYPFEFEKSFLQRSDYDAYFLDNRNEGSFALVLKDNKKAEYALLNKKFKVETKIPLDLKSTLFTDEDYRYAGGTVKGNEYHFLYRGKSDYRMETVDFDKKTVSQQKLFEFPKTEKLLVSFRSENRFYTVAANDETSELVFHTVTETGDVATGTAAFEFPEYAKKQKAKLSLYLRQLGVIKHDEEPDLSSVVHRAKLFTYPDRFEFVVNDNANPTHVVTVRLPDMRVQPSFVHYDGVVPSGEKGDVYISSFEKNGKLFSLLLNKKNIRLAVNDLASGSLLNKYEINEENGEQLFAQSPVTERRRGKREDAKDVTDVKKLIKALTNGAEGLMVTENKTGQLVVTIGTYDLIPLSSGGSSGGWVGGWQQSSMPTTPGIVNHGATVTATSTWNPAMYYRPGAPSYTTTSARYYTTTYFKLLLDPATLKTARGKLPQPVADQIKDYLETMDGKAKATNQFAIGNDQYYGYYDKETKSYVIEQIRITQ